MVNSQGPIQNGPPNGGYMQPQAAEQRPMARPFTLPEALPYSPQTSVIPFTSGSPIPSLQYLEFVVKLTWARSHTRPNPRLRLSCFEHIAHVQ